MDATLELRITAQQHLAMEILKVIFTKSVVLILITLQGMECTRLLFPAIKSRDNVPIVNIMSVNQSILYTREYGNDMLINSILREIFTEQPVLLVSGSNITKKGLDNRYSNTILLSETLNTEDFKSEVFKSLLVSHWSTLYLVITTRSQNYTCENGTLNIDAFAETKSYLNELWQLFRIIRVAVSFPYTCPKHYIIYDGKEWSGSAVYNRSIKLIKPYNKHEFARAITYSGDPHYLTKEYPLRVSIFYRFPTSIIECDVVTQYTNMNYKGGYCGLDGLIANDYTTYFKYDLYVEKDEECNSYGFVDSEHNITTGSLGCIVREKIDISFNSRFIWSYTEEAYYYLHYIAQDSLCAVTKRPGRIPIWHYVCNIFTPLIWIILLSTLIFLAIVTWLLAKVSAKFTNEKPLKLLQYLISVMYTTFFGLLVLKNDGRFLIFKGTSLISSVILLAVYQGHLNYQFTTRTHYSEVKTLEELFNSPCTLYISQSIAGLLKPSLEKRNLRQAVFLQNIQLRNTASTEFLLDNPDSATVARKQDFMIEVLQSYIDKDGMPRLYAINECFAHFYLSFMARKGFIFYEESVRFFMRLLEAGLPNQYYIWTQRTFISADRWPGIGPQARPFKPIKLKKLRIAFGWLAVGYVVSGIVFVIERWKKRK